jgi:hypothetical protein
MRKVCVLAFLAVALGSFALLGQAMDLETALSFFVNDQIMIEYSEAGHAQLEEIIAALKVGVGAPEDLNEQSEDAVGALEIDLSLKEVVNKLAQAYYTLANVFLTTPDGDFPTDTYLAGKHWGFKSLRMNPEFNDLDDGRFDDSVARETDVRAMYWTNSNWLRASTTNKLGAVFAGVPGKAEMLMNRILELDPEFIYGGVYRSLGGYYEQLPGLFGRDVDKARFYLCHVVNEPAYCTDCAAEDLVGNAYDYLENQTFFVEFYLIPEKHWEDANRILQDVLASEIGEDAPLMNAYSLEHAQQLYDEYVKEHVEP